MKTTYSVRTVAERPVPPNTLGIPGNRNDRLDSSWRRNLNVSNDFASCGISNFDNISFVTSEL
jgi:hypothetical protein